ncbi:MAG: hypothetical protein ACRDTD_14755, partial [Pseudonocardiaceae bacterium]
MSGHPFREASLPRSIGEAHVVVRLAGTVRHTRTLLQDPTVFNPTEIGNIMAVQHVLRSARSELDLQTGRRLDHLDA